MFNRTISGVEVFEVGVQQFRDFISLGHMLDNREKLGVRRGNYVIVHASAYFGKLAYISVMDETRGVSAAVRKCVEYQLLNLDMITEHGLTYADEYEVWHLVDDGDLWQVWDYDATEYQRRMSGYYGIRCMACNDDYGPRVTVFTIGGGRGYLCEGCYDRYNLINSFVGRVRLECL